MKKLEELFDLSSDIKEETVLDQEISEDIIEKGETALSNLDKIDNALSQVKGLDTADEELDELSKTALEGYKDLADLATQVDSRYSAELFAAASSMFGHALDAKKSKINKKLKMIELQLKKAALDQKVVKKDEEAEATVLGEGKALDRNELLKMFSNKTS